MRVMNLQFFITPCAAGALAAAGFFISASIPANAQITQQNPSQQNSLVARWRPSKSLAASSHAGRDPRRIIVKLPDGFGAGASDGHFTNLASNGTIVQTLRRFGAVQVTPLFTIPPSTLFDMQQSAQRQTSRAHADLSQYFIINVPAGADAQALLQSLLNRADVENAYFAPIAQRAPGNSGNPNTPNFSLLQNYKGAAPAGVEADFALANDPAGAATGVRIADLEYDWNLQHEDLSLKINAAPVGPTPRPPFTDPADKFVATQHGTAVLGILASDPDAHGMTGIAHKAGVRAVATATFEGESVANGILLAMQYLQPGDIILIEQQTPGPNFNINCGSYNNQGIHNQFGLVPVEYNDAEYDAIRLAVSNGYHVVEAAGNGAQDLDNLSNSGACSCGDPSYSKFDLNVRDSGAILVAAGTAAVPHVPTAFTNVGKRVDCFSWGEHVATLGFGDLSTFDTNAVGGNVNKFYTNEFGGTSAAAAIVAGCAAILESKHAISYSYAYPTHALRLLLRTSGTESATPREDRIGRQPNLKQQLQTVVSVKGAAIVRTGHPGARLGQSVAFSGQTSGDHLHNIIIGSPNDNDGAGRVDFVVTATGEAVTVWNGTIPGQLFGFSVAAAGDIDGDGIGDSIVGAPGGSGNVYIFSGYHYQPIQSTSDGFTPSFGFAVAGNLDLNADGVADFLVGAPQAGANPSGVVQIRSGVDGQLILQIDSAAAGEWLGYSTCSAGDVNGDGIVDILSGSPGATNSAGGASVVSGADGFILYHWNGQAAGDQFGAAVAGVGDCNSDGRPDIAIGAPFNNIGGPLSGRIYVFSGAGGGPLFRRSGDAAERLGYSLAGAGDVNRDHYYDVIAGAPGIFNNPNDKTRGHVYVYSGSTGSKVEIYNGEIEGDGFGLSVAGGVDADVNSIPDIIIGAPYNNYGGSDAGRAYVVTRSYHTLFGLASFGTGTPGCEGPQFIFGGSNPTINAPEYFMNCTNAPPSSMGIFMIANAMNGDGVDPFGLGVLFHIDLGATTEFFALPIFSNIAGYATVNTPIPNDPQLVGKTYIAQALWSWAFQVGTLCGAMPSASGLSSSNGLWMTIQPY